MSALRWLAEKIDKQNIVARENAAYGIAERRHLTNVSKAHELDADKLAAVSDPYTALSLRLQEVFGLRREESIKLRPAWADRGDVLHLKASWTKGGKERDIPIRTEAQRELLQEAKELAGAGSLIPAEMSYKDQLNRFKAQTARAGIDRVHGLRHHYAQTRYAELTGRKAPAGWPDHQATQRGAEGDRPASSADDLARAGARARADHSGVSWAMSLGRRDTEPQAHGVKHLVHRGDGRVPVFRQGLEQRLLTQLGPARHFGHAMRLGNLAKCQKQRRRVVHLEHGFQVRGSLYRIEQRGVQ
jgi:hypothetical protein